MLSTTTLAASNGKANSNGALRTLNFQVSGRNSVVMSTFSVFACGLSYGRSNKEFWHISIEIPGFDPLPRTGKLCDYL
jgi:hypothetical protein